MSNDPVSPFPTAPSASCITALPGFIQENYEIHEFRHACAILQRDFPSEWKEIVEVLSDFRLRRSWLITPGGRKSPLADWIDQQLTLRGWVERQFITQLKIDDTLLDSPTHSIDCYKNRIALELEWNNKDPFFDRDLNNFRLLFDLRAISAGIILTRSDGLQEIFDRLGRGKSYGSSTTHLEKLLPRIRGGGGGGCPILVFAMKSSLYREDL